MSIPKVSIKAECGRIFSPFTGEPIDMDDVATCERTTLFVYCGNVGAYAYVSPDLVTALRQKGVECTQETLSLEPDDVAERLDFPACFLLEIDAGWNGINYYCLRPPSGAS